MASLYGSLTEFQPDSDDVKAYLERVELYFAANKVDADLQVPIFLSSVGARTYSLLSDLLAPAAPKTKSFKELADTLCKHYEPKRAVISQRFHFHKRDQAVGESLASFDAAIRKLATHCHFGDKLEEALRDRFVCGLRHEALQRRLLSEVDLTYAKAMEIALAMEAADRDTKAFKTTDLSVKKFQRPTPSGDSQSCYRCNRPGHNANSCKFKDAECHACGKKGHIAPACRSKQRSAKKPYKAGTPKKTRKVHQVHSGDPGSSDSDGEYFLHKVGESSDAIRVNLVINGSPLEMEVDTGADVSIISDRIRRAVFPSLKLHPSQLHLKTYTGESVPIVGHLHVKAQYGSQVAKLVLVVVAGDGPSLLGRNWLKYLRLDWKKIARIHSSKTQLLHSVLDQHLTLFQEGLGAIEPYRATLQVKQGATPKFVKPRPVPFATKDAVGRELDRLEKDGILERVPHSDWAAPIVVVPKKDGSFRICGDYRLTVNPVLAVDQYPLPRPEDLFATLSGGTIFTKLDLSQAYLQVQLDDESAKYTTINTHQGLYQYRRLPFGVASAPALFQKLMDTVLQGIPGVICYIDDILLSSADESTHMATLEVVLARLQQHGFRLRKDKCKFLTSAVEYLGHIVNAEGVQATPEKVEAICQAPAPTNVTELRSLLGLVNYYGKFVPNLATILHPLNNLLKTDVKWNWTEECSQAFAQVKKNLTSAPVLTHYDPDLPINLAADASAYGVGAVIAHVFPDGTERPIAYASRSLTSSERNYAQIEREALSLVFGVKRFHQYLYGRKFSLVTDHKPLTAIFGSKKGIPSLAAARLQRWAILLSAYDYHISYKPTQQHGNADGLSRLPLPTGHLSEADDTCSLFNMGQIHALPTTAADVRKATRSDKVLSQVCEYVLRGWPAQVPPELQVFKTKQDEISLEVGCLLWGIRVIIPQSLQATVLKSLHANHPGITRMKSIARSYFWWSGLDRDIEMLAKSCHSCQAVKSSPPVAPLHPWVWPDAPWKRLHIDFAGPMYGKMFLVVIDAHSKWPEVAVMSSTTADSTIEVLRSLFARFGLPEQIVSDNGPQFVSEDFSQFLKRNGIKHIRSAPYHPSSNGLAERFIQTLKRGLKTSEAAGKSLTHRLSEFLFEYRSSPHATTNRSPSQLFLGRPLRTRLDLLRPNVSSQVLGKQASQKLHHDLHSKSRDFVPGQIVMVRDYRPNTDRWVRGKIVNQLGPVTYEVNIQGKVAKRHVDQLRILPGPGQEGDTTIDEPVEDNFEYPGPVQPVSQHPTEDQAPLSSRRYPQRNRHPPDRFHY